MQTTYKSHDVTVLLKDITGMIQPLHTAEREKLIQTGTHYSEMLPYEYAPSDQYIKIYNDALHRNADITAAAVEIVSEKIFAQKGEKVVLVSLARAGTSVGILIKRYLENKYHIIIAHYTISIIRGRGIDRNAMNYILSRHNASDLQFVDGWTGKGAILNELQKDLFKFTNVDDSLAVLADPAGITDMCGTHKDFLIPCSCLNATVSGLMSRTVFNRDLIAENDFHGAVFYKDLFYEDRTYEFIDLINNILVSDLGKSVLNDLHQCDYKNDMKSDLEEVARRYHINDINLIKPSIGETTRVLLRRVPWKVLVKKNHLDDPDVKHIVELAKEKNVDIIEFPLKRYIACGIIMPLTGSDA